MTEQAQDTQTAQTSENTTEGNAGGTSALPQWAQGLKPEYQEMVQAKGWKDPNDVLYSYRNMESFAGKVSSRGIVLPDNDDDAEGWGKVYSKLGRPEAPNGYEFSHIDIKANPELKDEVDAVAEIAYKHGLSKKQAAGFLQDVDARYDSKQAAAEAEAKRMAEKSISDLRGEWGQAFDANLNYAKTAAGKFGIEGDTLAQLEQTAGFAPMMKALAEVGTMLSEHGYVQGGGTQNTGMTPRQAEIALKEVQGDPDYIDPRTNPARHTALRQKAKDLYKAISAGNTN